MHKILVTSKINKLEDVHNLLTTAIVMDEKRTIAVFQSTESDNNIFDSDGSGISSQLYDDCYDSNELDIVEYTESTGGYDTIEQLTRFIETYYIEDGSYIYTDVSTDVYDYLKNEFIKINSDIFIFSIYDQFIDKEITYVPIEQIMKNYGINSDLMTHDSDVSRLYFYGVLIDRINHY